MTRLLLVRHGETDWNAQQRLQGRRDLPLTETGRAQVRALAERIRGYAPEHAVSSPLTRAAESCQLLGHLDYKVDKRWQESDLGLWEGRTSTELRTNSDRTYVRWRAGRHTPPQGESFETLRTRIGAAISDLVETCYGAALVVTHGGPIRAACAMLVGLDPAHVVPVAPASLTIIDIEEAGIARLCGYNITAMVQHTGLPGQEGTSSS